MRKLKLSNKEKLSIKDLIAKLHSTYEFVIERYGSVFIFEKGIAYRVKMFDLIGLTYSEDELEVEGSLEYNIDMTRAISMQYSSIATKIHKSNIVVI